MPNINVAFKCYRCNGEVFRNPEKPEPDALVTCTKCSTSVTYGDLQAIANKVGREYAEKISQNPSHSSNQETVTLHASTLLDRKAVIPKDEDSEERYQQHLAYLISRTKSRGNGRYFNQFVNRCREEAALAYPNGAAAAGKRNMATGGFLAALAAMFSFLG